LALLVFLATAFALIAFAAGLFETDFFFAGPFLAVAFGLAALLNFFRFFDRV
jgi:hypothetical protein